MMPAFASAASPIDPRWVASGLRKRILAPLATALVVLIAALITLILVSRSRELEQDMVRTAAAAEKMFEAGAQHKVGLMHSLLERVVTDRQLGAAFRAGDAARLVQLSQPLFDANHERNGITHFYFIRPDRKVLLRMHAPGHSGDRIDRLSLRQAQRTGLPAWRHEQGTTGRLTLRVVHPWRVGGELVGYVEMGMGLIHIAEEIKASLGADVVIALDKRGIEQAAWSAARVRAGLPDNWNAYDDVVITAATRESLPAPVQAYLAQQGADDDTANFEVRHGGIAHQVLAQPFIVGEERVGRLLLLRDITQTLAEHRLPVLRMVTLFVAVGGGLMVLFYVLLGRVERDVAARTARLEETQRSLGLEQDERQRTQLALSREQERNDLLQARARLVEELAAANATAQAALRENEAVTAALRETQGRLVAAAREAGRAEIATNVLHNVGNVLSSVNISAGLIGSTVRNSRLAGLFRALHLLDERSGDLGDYLTRDAKGKLLPGYLRAVGDALAVEQNTISFEVERLTKSIDHIKDIVATQQSHATSAHVIEPVAPAELAEEALRMQGSALARHNVGVVREYDEVPMTPLDRGRILQILVNLISNAKVAMSGSTGRTASLTLRVRLAEGGTRLQYCVQDEGEGIPPENLTRIFVHGFTTRATGHGFGLHSSAIAAGEMGGSLTAHSDGPGCGATFVLELPVAQQGLVQATATPEAALA